jgi:hypothetical protein
MARSGEMANIKRKVGETGEPQGETGLDASPKDAEKWREWRTSKVGETGEPQGETGLDGSSKGPASCKIVSQRPRALLSMSSSSTLISWTRILTSFIHHDLLTVTSTGIEKKGCEDQGTPTQLFANNGSCVIASSYAHQQQSILWT